MATKLLDGNIQFNGRYLTYILDDTQSNKYRGFRELKAIIKAEGMQGQFDLDNRKTETFTTFKQEGQTYNNVRVWFIPLQGEFKNWIAELKPTAQLTHDEFLQIMARRPKKGFKEKIKCHHFVKFV